MPRLAALAARTLSGPGVGLALTAGALCPQEPAVAPGEVLAERMQVGPLVRTFLLHVPPQPSAHPALVLVFHGGGGDGTRMRELVGRSLESLAAEHDFLVAYPDGYERHWNDCRGRTTFAAKRLAVDDVGFVRALVQRLVREHEVDPTRVFALGYSNGGHLAYRLALEVPGEVAAVAVFAATLPVELEMDCRPSDRPVSVMALLGTDDRISPYEGGGMLSPEMESRGHARSGPESLEYFARLAGYTVPPTRTEVFAAQDSGAMRVERTGWSRPGLPEVVLFTIHGGGHVIPGPHCEFPAPWGPCERRFDAVAEAVRFFFAQPYSESEERPRARATEPPA